MTKRKQYSAEHKNNVAMAAVRVDSKTTALSRKDEIQANIAVKWKREALDGMKEAFVSKGEQRRQPKSRHEDPSGKDWSVSC